MKTGSITAAIGLVGLAAAHGAHHARHNGLHNNLHNKREMVYHTVTDMVTDVTEEIIYYVDDAGKTVSTETIYKTMPHTVAAPPPASTPEVVTTAVSTSTVAPKPTVESSAAPSPSEQPAKFLAAVPEPAKASAAPSSSSPSSSSSSGSESGSTGGIGFGNGIAYSPYNADHSCKKVSQISQDLSSINVDVVRLYGTDCNQVANTLAALKGRSTQLLAGIFDIGSATAEAQTIIDAVNGDWSRINSVSVGNEVVNDGGSVKAVVDAVNAVRKQLRAAGFNGPVVTVDTMVAHKANPQLCDASDFCAMNCHAFFDSKTVASGAGPFVLDWVKQIKSAHPDKQVIVTESGWPSKGSSNGLAVPSPQNQVAAVNSLNAAFSSNLILYSAYNDLWKTSDAAQFNAEQYWGIHGMAPSSGN